MKILCDVCNKEESTVFCPADEAALCDGCDERVHGANKLASKHDRHSLTRQTSQGSPPCDICQERHALFFCREDRAIFCRECDLRIHAANRHTRSHSRFLLTGARISASASSSQSSPSPYSLDYEVSDMGRTNNRISFPSQLPVKMEEIQTSSEYLESSTDPVNSHDNEFSAAASSISEYFTKTLPGWRVDDFLDPHPPQFDGYCKAQTSDDKFPISEDSVENIVSQSLGVIAQTAKTRDSAKSKPRRKLGCDVKAAPSSHRRKGGAFLMAL